MTNSIDFAKNLDACKRQAPDGGEYWTARDIQSFLGYVSWEKFEQVIERAVIACDSSGVESIHHLHRTVNMVGIGSGAQRERGDWFLSRYGSYLIAMNADSSKPEIAFAQQYFAVQTRLQEIQNQLTETERRAMLRERVRDANKLLGEAAKNANVQRYAIFHDAGYKKLYDGLGVREIKQLKGIPEKDDLLDCVGRAELAMHEFRATQAEQKIVRENIKTEDKAILAHGHVAAEVRKAVQNMGGVMPEDLPAEPNIKKLVKPKRMKELAEMNRDATKKVDD